jgi:hypothetical protein
MTLAQTAEKPMTVATEEAISSFADSRHGLSAPLSRRPNRMPLAPNPHACDRNIAVGLSKDNDARIS